MVAITLVATFLRLYRLNDYPPALYLDEAWDAFDALRVLRTASLYIFFGGSYGREPLMIHLQALSFWLWGANGWALRLVSAVAGVITVPTIYRVAAELFRDSGRAKWVGVLAAGMLAVSFWHVDVSRLSPRVILVPLFGIPSVWAFWRGWTSHRLRYFVFAGLLIGASLYSYPAARLIPVVLVGFVGASLFARLFWRDMPAVDVRRAVIEIGITTFVAGFVFVPLAVYYLQNPGAFFVRSADTLVFPGRPDPAPLVLAENIVRVVRLFIDQGDMNWRHNLPGRAPFDILQVVGFWIGLAIALFRFRKTPAYLILLIWLGLNLAPTALTLDAPHFLRAIFALPAACILAAEGLARIWQRPVPRLGWAPLVLAVVTLGGVMTFNDYVNVWGPDRETYYAFDGSIDSMVREVMSLSETADVILPLNVFGSAQMSFALANRYPQQIPTRSEPVSFPAWLITGPVQRMNIVIGPQGVFVPQPLDDDQVAKVKVLLRNGTKLKTGFGDDIATKLYLENGVEFVRPPVPAQPLGMSFGHVVRILGSTFDRTTLAPGDKLRLTLYWQALQDLNSDYVVSTVLLDPQGESIAQRTSEPVFGDAATSLWRQGIIIPDNFDIQIPADAHEGMYRLEVGLLDRKKADLLLPLIGSQDRLLLDSVTVTRSPVSPELIKRPVRVTLGEPTSIALIGYDMPEQAGVEAELPITLYWRSERPLPIDYSVFVHLIDANGKMVTQQDGPPQRGNAPTSWWRPGETVRDDHALVIPADATVGRYQIELGIYDSATGQRLPIYGTDGRRQPDDRWLLPIELRGP